MTVARMRREMTEREFQTWWVWHAIRVQNLEMARERARG